MHIPDGYLSPATCAVGFAIAVPTIVVASRRVPSRCSPLLRLFMLFMQLCAHTRAG